MVNFELFENEGAKIEPFNRISKFMDYFIQEIFDEIGFLMAGATAPGLRWPI